MFKLSDLMHTNKMNSSPDAHSTSGMNNQSYLNVGNNGTAKMMHPTDKPFIPFKGKSNSPKKGSSAPVGAAVAAPMMSPGNTEGQ